jgi:hypothetical protein
MHQTCFAEVLLRELIYPVVSIADVLVAAALLRIVKLPTG